MKEQYTWDEIFKALDFLEKYDEQFDVIGPCPPHELRKEKCEYKCETCRLKFALENTIK